MNELLSQLQLQAWKPVLTALLLPPVPLLVLTLWGARRLAARRRGGWTLVLLASAGLWLSTTTAAATGLAHAAGLVPPALTAERLTALARQVEQDGAERPRVAIVVLGGGREVWAPEYGAANLSPESLLRLRYGLWLARASGAPVAFSGGRGWSQRAGEAEADIASRIAAKEFGQALRWVENTSRDTRDNAARTLPLLRADGVDHLLLVTHGWHMRRAVRAFETAAGAGVRVEAAPLALSEDDDHVIVDWLPSGRGALRFRGALREWIGLALGA